MRVKLRADDNVVTFTFELEDDDRDAIVAPDGTIKARFAGGSCHYVMPEGWRAADTHPDLIGAVAIALAGNFAGKHLKLPFGVSGHLQERVAESYKFQLQPIDSALKPRRAPRDARPGLCYSGGVDSTAALLLLPSQTVSAFVDRVAAPDGQGSRMYRKEAALRACRVLREMGREVWAIPTNIEYLREPVGFFNDLVMATPLILLADWLTLDSIAYGLILEVSYLKHGKQYREYKPTLHFTRYGGVASAVDLHWNLVTAGLSEAVTTSLVLQSPLHHVAQSCVRADFGRACENCWKCFRKSLLTAALANETLSDKQLDRYFEIPDAQRHLETVPITLENVIMFVAQRYRGSHPRMLQLKRMLRVDDVDLAWMERWFTPSREVLAEQYRSQCEASITRLVEPMTDQDVASIRAWDRLPAAEAAGRLAATTG